MGKAARQKRQRKTTDKNQLQAGRKPKRPAYEEVVRRGTDAFASRSPAEAIVELSVGTERLASKLSDTAAERLGARRACRDKCCHCCTYRVVATPIEVLMIVEYVRARWSKEELDALRAKVAQMAEKASRLNRDEWQLEGQFCPLLVDGSRGIHAIRSLACVGWSSASELDCVNSVRNLGQMVQFFAPQWELCNEMQDAIFDVLRLEGLQSDPVELITALNEALELPDVAEKWLSGDFHFRSATLTPKIDAKLPSFRDQIKRIRRVE